MNGNFVTRFAPSPTGYLHRGHAFSALSAFATATRAQGRFLLRIEDIDTDRCRGEYAEAIEDDLEWLGLEWERPVRRQSDHMADYRAALEDLRIRSLIYPCKRTRAEVLNGIARAPQADDPRDETLESDQEGPTAWRLSIDAAERALGGFANLTFVEEGSSILGKGDVVTADPRLSGDVILARKSLGVSYHLAATVDDARQEVSHVIRGADLFPSTHVQRLLQALLNLPTPVYRHHPLLLRPDGKRFAKRDSQETLRELRSRGASASELRATLGF